MSLQIAAQHLASRGRGPDSMLVHMAPSEVQGLQALARAHGGSLTINPQTGLPEAGFLSSILPIVAGAALNAFAPGLGSAVGSALGGIGGAAGTGILVGGLTGLATGSLRKGLMAGLGAYGGAGLMGSVTGAGTTAIGDAASAASAGVPGATAAQPVVVGAPMSTGLPQATALAPTEYAGFAPTATQYGAFGEAPLGAAAPIAPAAPTTVTQMPVEAASPASAYDYRNAMDIQSDIAAPREAALRAAGPTGRVTAGLKAVADKPSLLLNKDNMKYGLAALAPFMMQEEKRAATPSDSEAYRYAYNPGRVANPTRVGGIGEKDFFNPTFTRLAEGGPVQAMSDRNAQEMFFTNGGQRFAEGGDTAPLSYIYDPLTQTYKDTRQVQPVQTVTQMPGASRSVGNEYGPSPAGDPDGSNAGWSSLTPSQQAAYYAANPTMAAITQTGQGLFGMTALGQLQNALVPNFVQQQQMIAKGIDPFGMAGLTPQQQSNVNQALSGYLESSMNQPSGGVTVGFDPGGFGAYGENVAPSGGVEVGGPISSGDVTGVDVGPAADAGPGDGAGSAAAGSGSDDLARGGIAGYARGGYNLGDYSDGGCLLRGPGDGVSDSIPASIAGKRPARLADGEFVVPARIVSELGNGSTEAGARKLYAMMDRIQKARSKSIGKGKVAVNSRAEKLLPA